MHRDRPVRPVPRSGEVRVGFDAFVVRQHLVEGPRPRPAIEVVRLRAHEVPTVDGPRTTEDPAASDPPGPFAGEVHLVRPHPTTVGPHRSTPASTSSGGYSEGIRCPGADSTSSTRRLGSSLSRPRERCRTSRRRRRRHRRTRTDAAGPGSPSAADTGSECSQVPGTNRALPQARAVRDVVESLECRVPQRVQTTGSRCFTQSTTPSATATATARRRMRGEHRTARNVTGQ